jgi:arylamine N-acetyltransferase
MNPADFPVEQYLKRIGLAKMPGADETGLQAIHAAHVFSIPFENKAKYEDFIL